jgi:SAM-dependent methyltransferase
MAIENGPASSIEMGEKLNKATQRRNRRIASWDDIRASITDPTPEGLAPIDQLHSGGLAFTRLLAKLAEVRKGEKVLDVGCGAGGPARVLAAEKGAIVTGIDIAAGLIELAKKLGEISGIPATFQEANALQLPFEDASFDLVWTQHAAGTIADKAKFYSEMRRVLRPGGRLAMHDLTQGSKSGCLHMPIPCADSEDVTFLLQPESLKGVLSALGFREILWRDLTDATIAWFRMLPPPGTFSIRLIKGEGFPEMVENLKLNLQEGRIKVAMGIFEAS